MTVSKWQVDANITKTPSEVLVERNQTNYSINKALFNKTIPTRYYSYLIDWLDLINLTIIVFLFLWYCLCSLCIACFKCEMKFKEKSSQDENADSPPNYEEVVEPPPPYTEPYA